jgi:hypothetical protein
MARRLRRRERHETPGKVTAKTDGRGFWQF